MKTKVGLYGGAFDPFHNGHLAIIEAVQDQWHCNPLVVMPTANPAHKAGHIASVEDRIHMASEAISHVPHVTVSPWEANQTETNYTISTVQYLLKEYDVTEIQLVIGSDSFNDLPRWYQWPKLLEYCHFIVAIRQGDNFLPDSALLEEVRRAKRSVHILQREIPGISSTELRNALKIQDIQQNVFSKFLPPSVERYLIKNNLYATKGAHYGR